MNKQFFAWTSALVTIVVTVLLTFSMSFVFAETKEEKEKETNVIETVFKVENLSCGGCLTTINTALKEHDGMVDMSANLRLGLIGVQHTEKFLDDDIAKVITDSGYPAKKISSEEYEKIISWAKKQYGLSGGGNSGCGGGCSGCVASQPGPDVGSSAPLNNN